MNILDLLPTMDDIISKMEESTTMVTQNLDKLSNVVDVLADFDVGSQIPTEELSELISTIADGQITLSGHDGVSSVLITDGVDRVENLVLSSTGEVIDHVPIIDAGEVVGSLTDTLGNEFNIESMLETVIEAEAINNATNVLINLQKEGSLSYANFMSSVSSVANIDTVLNSEELAYMMEASRHGSASIYAEILRKVGIAAHNGPGPERNIINFESYDYNPLKFLPINWSLIGDVVTSVAAGLSLVFGPLMLIPAAIYQGSKLLVNAVSNLEGYSIDTSATNNRLSIPLFQSIHDRNEVSQSLLDAVDKSGFVRYQHLGLDHFMWKGSDNNIYAELFIRVEVQKLNPVLSGDVVNLTWVPNNINRVSAYPVDVDFVTVDESSSRQFIDSTILTSLLIAYRLILPDGVTLHAPVGSKLRSALGTFSGVDDVTTDLIQGAFSEFRIVAELIPEGLSAVNDALSASGSSLNLTGHLSTHYSWVERYDFVTPDYVQSGDEPTYVSGMQHGDVIELGVPYSLVNLGGAWYDNPNRVYSRVHRYNSLDNRPMEDRGNLTAGYHFLVRTRDWNSYPGNGITNASAQDISDANAGLFKYQTVYTYSTDYDQDMARDAAELFHRRFHNFNPFEYMVTPGIFPNQTSQFEVIIKYVISGTSYWKKLRLSAPGLSSELYQAFPATQKQFDVIALDVVGEPFLYKSVSDRLEMHLNPTTKGEFFITPPKVRSGVLIKTLAAVIAVTATVVLTTILIKRASNYRKLRRLVDRQKAYSEATIAFNDDPTYENYRVMAKARRRLGRASRRAGDLSNQFDGLSRLNNTGFNSTKSSITDSASILSNLSSDIYGEVSSSVNSIKEIKDLIKPE